MNLEPTILARLLLDAYSETRIADRTTTRSTKEARTLGITSGHYDGIRAVAEIVCRAHAPRINALVRDAYGRTTQFDRTIISGLVDLREDEIRELGGDLARLQNRSTCGDQILWRDEDVAMARKDLAPFKCVRLPGHDGQCAMHPVVASKLDTGQPVTTADYALPGGTLADLT